MNTHRLLQRGRPHCIRISHHSHGSPYAFNHNPSLRGYATHREAGQSLSQSLDTSSNRRAPSDDTVGPFRLGVSQATLRNGEKAPKWSELSTGGKVMRTTARTTNLGVILLGAGLSALLVYSLTSELFSKNSPTVLYGDACERIKASPRVAKYLNGPYTFHNNPPSAIRPRHRNRHVTSQIFVDTYGNEHMIMTFYVHGQPPGSSLENNLSRLDSITTWAQEAMGSVSDLTLDDSVQWTKQWAEEVWDRGKRAFRYLSGSPLSPPLLQEPQDDSIKGTRGSEESSKWSFSGMFGSLRGVKGGAPAEVGQKGDGRVFTDGEVHADLVRNQDGYFVFRYLLVDIPSTRDRNPIRVFVERSNGVRDSEPVMRWNS